jgi:hypothetical protein
VTATHELNNFGAGDSDFVIFWPKKAEKVSKKFGPSQPDYYI